MDQSSRSERLSLLWLAQKQRKKRKKNANIFEIKNYYSIIFFGVVVVAVALLNNKQKRLQVSFMKRDVVHMLTLI